MTNQPDETPNTDRVARILRRAHRETASRDVISFAFGRAWAALLALGSLCFSILQVRAPRPPKSPSGKGSGS